MNEDGGEDGVETKIKSDFDSKIPHKPFKKLMKLATEPTNQQAKLDNDPSQVSITSENPFVPPVFISTPFSIFANKSFILKSLRHLLHPKSHFTPSLHSLSSKTPEALKRVRGFSVGNKYQHVLFLDSMNLWNANFCDNLKITQPNYDKKCLGLSVSGMFLDKKALVRVFRVSKRAKSRKKLLKKRKKLIKMIMDTYNVKEIHYIEKTDTLVYEVENFRVKNSH
ncbi:unnamed protein product [Moneuplotes crassus]|uniref:Peptidase S59 domain-containing protein n=1 Tax=Euplotes crassus TaxID=5936 RepID=A0AAD1XS49_EUPCR|nr:unnamed protein product [Moneuplotes crassus]